MKRKQLVGVVGLIALALVTVGLTSAIAGRVKKSRELQTAQPLTTTPTLNQTTPTYGPNDVIPNRNGRAINVEEFNREHGMSVSFAHEAEVLEPKSRQLLALLLVAFDPNPDARSEHFAWLDKFGLARRGWYAQVKNISPIATGKLIEVRMSPCLARKEGGIPMTPDYFTEFYYFDGARLVYLCDSAAQPDRTQILFID